MTMHRTRLLAALAFGLSLAACTQHVAPPPGAPAGLSYTPPRAAPWTPRGTLVVQVVTHEEGRPIEGAVVHMNAPDDVPVYAISTDSAEESGEFRLRRWPRGTYVLTAKRNGFGRVSEWVRVCGGRQDTVVVRLRSAGCDLLCQGVPRGQRRATPCGRRVLD